MTAIEKINLFLWGYPLPILITLGGLYLSFRLSFPQLHILRIFRETAAALFHKDFSDSSALSQLQGFSTALAATVGTGSIVGVGAALSVGGVGAVFYMWVSAFIGMGISYCENYLGVKYSGKSRFCGAMSYLSELGAGEFPAYLYAFFSVLASLGMGNMTQANSAVAAGTALGINKKICTAAIIVFVLLTVIGKNSAARLCERLIPLGAVLFIGGSLFVILLHPMSAVAGLKSIIVCALSPKAAAGGIIGTAFTEGIKRGIFSNEAGLGSTCAIHSSCGMKSGRTQGITAIAEIYIDTVVVCTLTALVIIISGTDLSADCAVKAYGIALGDFGRFFISACLILFALATMAAYFFIGERSWQCLFSSTDGTHRKSLIYPILYIICAYIGSAYSPTVIWGISDIFNALTAIPNMTAVIVLAKEIEKPFSMHNAQCTMHN